MNNCIHQNVKHFLRESPSCSSWNLHSYLRTLFFFSRNSSAEKCNQLCIEQKQVSEAGGMGKKLRGKSACAGVGRGAEGSGFHFISSTPLKKKKGKGKKSNDKSQK